MRLTVHKLFLSSAVAFALAFSLGACTPPEVESCEQFKEKRDACDAMNGSDQEPDNANLCDDVDAECKEFYDCARQQECKDEGGVFRLDYAKICTMPEGKECTEIAAGQ